jgi:hypothetical protein
METLRCRMTCSAPSNQYVGGDPTLQHDTSSSFDSVRNAPQMVAQCCSRLILYTSVGASGLYKWKGQGSWYPRSQKARLETVCSACHSLLVTRDRVLICALDTQNTVFRQQSNNQSNLGQQSNNHSAVKQPIKLGETYFSAAQDLFEFVPWAFEPEEPGPWIIPNSYSGST